jgi:NAD+ kinase
MYRNADFVVVLGGDGTILRVARHAAVYDVPIQGINIGTLGYLADVERNKAKEAIKNVIEGRFKTDERMMLEASLGRGCHGHDTNIALNEVYVTNAAFSRVIQLGLEINGDYVSSYRADGIMVSTATGSTAYNLSAGGPILKPDTQLMAITHVCPHSLTSRPLVISGNDVVRIRVESSYSNAMLNMDGQESIPLVNGDVVTIRRSKYVTKTIRTTDMSFYDILRNKMYECN